jgi:hypothetical protein
MRREETLRDNNENDMYLPECSHGLFAAKCLSRCVKHGIVGLSLGPSTRRATVSQREKNE